MLAHEAQAHLKLKLLKGKLLAAKAPHVLAKIAVAKEVKIKSKIAAVKTIAAVSIIRREYPKNKFKKNVFVLADKSQKSCLI